MNQKLFDGAQPLRDGILRDLEYSGRFQNLGVLNRDLDLNPDNFDKLQQRAPELRQHSSQPVKSHYTADRMQSDHVQDAGPRKRRHLAPHTRPLDIRPPDHDAPREPDDENTSTRVVGSPYILVLAALC
jgi:hypothetical protein